MSLLQRERSRSATIKSLPLRVGISRVIDDSPRSLINLYYYYLCKYPNILKAKI